MKPTTRIANSYFLTRWKSLSAAIAQPHEAQRKTLFSLIKQAQNTTWGQFYGYKNITTYEQFAATVPVSKYETIHHLVQRIYQGESNVMRPGKINAFAKTSGTTTGGSKLIPMSKANFSKCHYAGAQDVLTAYTHLRPQNTLFDGKVLGLGGSYTPHSFRPGAYEGDLSGLLAKFAPKRSMGLRYPPPRFSKMTDWNEKMEKLVPHSVHRDIRAIAGIPSWITLFLQKVQEHTGKSIKDIWPNFQLLGHGGISIQAYEEELRTMLPEHTCFMDIYSASEGMFAVQDQEHTRDMLLLPSRGIFYEFRNMQTDEIVPLARIQPGVDYSILITTNAGMWRYELGDVVRFTDTYPYRLRVVGRLKLYLNKYGEHVSQDNIDATLKHICDEHQIQVGEYMVGYDGKSHHWCIELTEHTVDGIAATSKLDQKLQHLNDDYATMRRDDAMLTDPKVSFVRAGTFMQWLHNNDRVGGQYKVPRIDPDNKHLPDLLEIAKQ